jgi:Ca2+-binding EF-hand superfamily protein
MSTSRNVMLVIGAVALGATALAGASLADGKRGYHRGGHHGGPGRHERMIEQFDADQDGAITQVEIDQVRRDRLAAFDQNNDGSLTLEEYQALWLDAMRERMVDRFQDLDDDGDAIVTVEEFVEPFGSMVGRLDRNGDGALSRDDMRRGPHHRAPDDEDDEDD